MSIKKENRKIEREKDGAWLATVGKSACATKASTMLFCSPLLVLAHVIRHDVSNAMVRYQGSH